MNIKRDSTLIDLFLGTIMFSSIFAEMDVYLTNVEVFNYAPEIVKNASCYLNRTAQSLGSLNLEMTLAQDVEYADGVFILTIQRGAFLTNFTTMELNYCQLLSSVESQFLLKMTMMQIRRISNLPLECPLKKNKRYYINGFTTRAKFLPSYIPELNFISDIQINFENHKGLRVLTHGNVTRRH